ncbi:MAG TPA: AmmeMemoRadiSam system protein A [Polyangiaceae bacterium]|nr:AmmeMemoRadiSam system protein A [Polyangiaceae bacterium]
MPSLPDEPSERAVAGSRALAGTPEEPLGLGGEERRALLGLARRSITTSVREGRRLTLPDGLPPSLLVPRAAFVTLEMDGALRGCIGNLTPQGPLALAVVENARAAALRDPRFPPVVAREIDRLTLEVSVLGPSVPLAFVDPADLLRRLTPHRDGVVLALGGQRATFLPQVWDKLPDPEVFLDHLARKAGATPGAWRGPGVTVATYRVEAFSEEDHGDD